MSHKPTYEELVKEIARLNYAISHWRTRYAALEAKVGVTLPILALTHAGKTVHLWCFNQQPLVLADDVLAQLPDAPKKNRGARGEQVPRRLRALGLGSRELLSIPRAEIVALWNTSQSHASKSLGLSPKAQRIAGITPLGIESLRDRAPKFCKWIETEAFPKAIEQLGKRGA